MCFDSSIRYYSMCSCSCSKTMRIGSKTLGGDGDLEIQKTCVAHHRFGMQLLQVVGSLVDN